MPKVVTESLFIILFFYFFLKGSHHLKVYSLLKVKKSSIEERKERILVRTL